MPVVSHVHWFNGYYICYHSEVIFITSPTEGDGRLCFRRRRYVGRYMGRYVCEQLPGANSSPMVTKPGELYPWPQGTK